MLPQHPHWSNQQPFQAVIEQDWKTLADLGEKGLLELIMATHGGMTADEFSTIVTKWLANSRHPSLNRPYTDLVYAPMVELLGYLRENGFKTFIESYGYTFDDYIITNTSNRIYGDLEVYLK